MIYYFSGTGNSRWVARLLAEKTGDSAADLTGVSRIPDLSGTTFGIVFPIYAWGIPEPVREFLSRLRGRPDFSFGVCTCGEEAGLAMTRLRTLFPMDSTYSVALPSNYIIGEDVESEASIRRKIEAAEVQLRSMAVQISGRQPVDEVNKGSLFRVKSGIISPLFDRFARSTKPFSVDDCCTSCGLCAQLCPAQTIRLENGKPRWGSNCYQCTACINRCPVQAIQYGKSTARRRRYYFEMYGSSGEPVND